MKKYCKAQIVDCTPRYFRDCINSKQQGLSNICNMWACLHSARALSILLFFVTAPMLCAVCPAFGPLPLLGPRSTIQVSIHASHYWGMLRFYGAL